MADTAAEESVEEAIGFAAEKVTNSDDLEEAERWQTIQNQQTAALATLQAQAALVAEDAEPEVEADA